MDTGSFQFVLFGIAAALLSNLSPSRYWRSFVLMLATLVFLGILAHYQAVLLLPLAGFLLLGYSCLQLLQRGLARMVAPGVLAVILAYVWLKKYTFLPEQTFLHWPYFTLGLSYIFFRVLHLLIESGDRKEGSTPISFGAYLLYTLNFTSLVSGPIQRYEDFARDQFALDPIPLGIREVGTQIERIVRGFFKVNVLALLFHAVQDDALLQLSQPLPFPYKTFAALRLVIVYPLFLYCNFSGYIDIVIAIARLMRLQLPENFDRPFSAPSFIEFWNRWHISLSMWLKTYVYNPLLLFLMRRISSISVQPILGVISFFVTFFLIGVWHGRTSEFAVFGILQGGGVAVNKIWQLWMTGRFGRKGYKQIAANPLYIAFARGLTFSWFSFTLFWFWASWSQIDRVFTALSPLQWTSVWLSIWLLSTLVLAGWERLRSMLLSIQGPDGPLVTHRYALTIYASALALLAFIMTAVLSQPAPGIVYKAF